MKEKTYFLDQMGKLMVDAIVIKQTTLTNQRMTKKVEILFDGVNIVNTKKTRICGLPTLFASFGSSEV